MILSSAPQRLKGSNVLLLSFCGFNRVSVVVGLDQPHACVPIRCTLALLCMRVGPYFICVNAELFRLCCDSASGHKCLRKDTHPVDLHRRRHLQLCAEP